MSYSNDTIHYYVYLDLRHQQNNNPEGCRVERYETLEEAIRCYKRQPADWTSAIGVHLPPYSEIDLVQRREGEDILVGDYQRIPKFSGNGDVQAAVRKLVDDLAISWQSEYRILGGWNPLLIPLPDDLDHIRDRSLNGKSLSPRDEKHLESAILEAHVPGEGWTSLADIYAEASKCGYNDPHIPKVTMLNAAYCGEDGRHGAEGDMTPYNFILMKERTAIQCKDGSAAEKLAGSLLEFISRHDAAGYADLFGDVKADSAVASAGQMLLEGELSPLVRGITKIAEQGFPTPWERSEARELLGRILNVPEAEGNKLSMDLRLRATAILNGLYCGQAVIQENTKAPIRMEGR